MLREVQDGSFAKEWESEQKEGMPLYKQFKEFRELHPIVDWERSTRKAFRMD